MNIFSSDRLRKDLDTERRIIQNKLLHQEKCEEETRMRRENQVCYIIL